MSGSSQSIDVVLDVDWSDDRVLEAMAELLLHLSEVKEHANE
jgi:hypothetical protein